VFVQECLNCYVALQGQDPRIRPVPAVERTFAVLRFLARLTGAQTLSEFAGPLGIIPSTGLHLLPALVAEGLVNFDPDTRRYRLGSRLISLSRAALNGDELVHAVQPVLDRLSGSHGAGQHQRAAGGRVLARVRERTEGAN
jgi:DNA-binding IclR family transcriptional regulator